MGFPCGGGSLVMVGFPCGAGFPYGGDSFVCIGIPLCWGFPCGGGGFPSGEFPMWGGFPSEELPEYYVKPWPAVIYQTLSFLDSFDAFSHPIA